MKSIQSWQSAAVEALRDLSPTVREFTLRPAGGTAPWTPGAHLEVEVPLDGRADLRHYSLVGLPEPGVYRIAVKRVAHSRGGSRHLWSLAVGDTLRIAGPNNQFELPLASPATLLVAGGIGITPIVGMALRLAAQGADVRLRYAARANDELVYAQRLREALGDRMATFVGHRIDFDAEIAALAPQAQMLVCGPAPMLDAARDAWRRAGRPEARLRFETFGSGGALPAQAFWVKLPRHGVKIEVPADRTLLDVLEQCGVETLSDCRRGECGLCALDIVELQGTLDHRDVFLSSAEKREGRRLCACVSRVAGGGVVLDTAYRPD